ncbi:MAG TPA: hypothetical protein VJ725_20230 [Thermoanaerobaculia bacterium]|nr:hypothetical protein [Thermoanaerobaculia bacterium]
MPARAGSSSAVPASTAFSAAARSITPMSDRSDAPHHPDLAVLDHVLDVEVVGQLEEGDG